MSGPVKRQETAISETSTGGIILAVLGLCGLAGVTVLGWQVASELVTAMHQVGAVLGSMP